MQWIVGGSLNYAPLVGLPAAPSLHQEDAALHRLVLASLRTRITAEHVSLAAPRKFGGLALPSVTEMLVAAVPSDLLCLLNGSSQTSLLARDVLRQALQCDPSELDSHSGLVTDAVRFLAGYGLYLSLSTDRFVGRVLDALAPSTHQPLLGAFQASAFHASGRYARVGVLANSIRLAWSRFLHAGLPPSLWADPARWQQFLPPHVPVSHIAVARAASVALAQSRVDWQTECRLFGVPVANIPEWLPSSWEHPWIFSHDLRSKHLLQSRPPPAGSDESALYGDGGFSPQLGASFCCQVRGFGSGCDYWHSASWAIDQTLGRAPSFWLGNLYGSYCGNVFVGVRSSTQTSGTLAPFGL